MNKMNNLNNKFTFEKLWWIIVVSIVLITIPSAYLVFKLLFLAIRYLEQVLK